MKGVITVASLIGNLTLILEEICVEYESLLELSMKKTPVIITGDLDKMAIITDDERLVISKINKLDQAMGLTMSEIAEVINKDVSELDLTVVIGFMGPKPEEQQKLAIVHDRLKNVTQRVTQANEHNRELISDSLDMIQFEMNILQAAKAAPGTANYDRSAVTDGSVIGVTARGFDAKQ
ncbi:MAG: flagellar protein FlgN [Lachnospiraceae bacterium]|jgi:flagellar biosynthesis/type III secretory pathway chaperone|nr:flagellar protein FlgN [Lachnospiraceae bacterium]